MYTQRCIFYSNQQCIGLSKLDAEQQASALVNSADDFSVPFCQLELQLLFKIHTESDEEGELGVADAIIQSIKASVEADKSTWPDLLTGLDGEMTRKVCTPKLLLKVFLATGCSDLD